MEVLGNSSIGEHTHVGFNCIIGYPSAATLKKINSNKDFLDSGKGANIGKNCVIRPNTHIYESVNISDNVRTGHNVLIRENTKIGKNVVIGTNSIIENNCKIGNNVSVQSNVYIPTNTTIKDFVFIGPNVCLTNDRYPVRIKSKLTGPTIENGVSIGANATILPGIKIGKGSFVAAGALVTKNIRPWKLAVGMPAKELDLPRKLLKLNKIR